MIGKTSLEVYSSVFNLTEGDKKFKFFTDLFDEFLFTELKDELEEFLGISDKSPKHLQSKRK